MKTLTDSCIISFDAWYRFILSKVYNIDMNIKHEKRNMIEIINADEWGDKPLKEMVTYVEPKFDYNFYTDEVIELERLIEPCALVPQDTLRYSIINIIAYVCGDLIVDYLTEYCKLTGSHREGVRTCMIMKNEFTMSRVMLTEHRRNYAANNLLQEGNIIPKGKGVTIAGLNINKTTLSEDTRKKLQRILYEDILTTDNVDQIHVMKKLIIFEREIYNSIMNKETKYYKPDNIGAIYNYDKDPLSVNGILAATIYNEMRSEDMEYINLNERNKIIKIKINVTKKNVDKIKDSYPEDYAKLVNLLNHPILGSKVTVIGLPINMPVPDWVLSFVDFNSIINDQLKNFPLDSIGLNRLDNDSVNVSNIIQL